MNTNIRRTIATVLVAGSFPLMMQPALAEEPTPVSPAPVDAAKSEPAGTAAQGAVTVDVAADAKKDATATSAKQEKKPEKKAEEPKPSFPIGHKISRKVQTYTGVNWLAQAISSKLAARAIKRKVGGSVNVSVKTYSLTDLMAGKVKSVTVKLKGAKFFDVGLGTIEANTCQPVWVSPFKKKNRSRGVQSPVLISVKATLTQKDVTDALQSPQVVSTLRGLNLDLPGLGEQQLQIIKPSVDIKDDLIFIKAVLVTKGGSEDTGVPVSMSAKPILVNQSD
ncbi:MAG: DUF2993 domain-containing protein, partial [Cyanobacteria bacterium]|nr:DUF2993 domain-containing protein [Cyanobacteriota bacterium]